MRATLALGTTNPNTLQWRCQMHSRSVAGHSGVPSSGVWFEERVIKSDALLVWKQSAPRCAARYCVATSSVLSRFQNLYNYL